MILKRLAFVLFILMSLIIQTVLAGQLDYQEKQLPNGMKVIYRLMPETKTTALRVVIHTGILNESVNLYGISHLLEHLIYRGSEKYSASDFQHQISDRGGSYNGFTMLDRTEYLLDIPSEDFIPALTIYLSQIFNPNLLEHDLNLEKKVVTVEQAMRYTSGNVFFFYLNELTAQRFNASVNNIRRDDLITYHQQYYQPNQATIIITGAFNLSKTIEILTSVGSIPQSKIIEKPAWQIGILKNNILTLEDYLQGEEYQFLVSFQLLNPSRKELLIAKILPYILSYESRSYEPTTGRPLDYGIDLLNLKGHYFLVFIYRDCQEKYSVQLDEWHRKNLNRYCKLLKYKKFSKFLGLLCKSKKNNFAQLKSEPIALNEFYAQKIFDPTFISDDDLEGISKLSSGDFGSFVQKYLEGKTCQKIIIKAL